MIETYLELMDGVGRIHRTHFEIMVKIAARMGLDDVNGHEAFVLCLIGKSKVNANQVRNASNLGFRINSIIRELVKKGYVLTERAAYDERVVNVWLSEKGRNLENVLSSLHERYMNRTAKPRSRLGRSVKTLYAIEQVLIDHQLDGYRILRDSN